MSDTTAQIFRFLSTRPRYSPGNEYDRILELLLQDDDPVAAWHRVASRLDAVALFNAIQDRLLNQHRVERHPALSGLHLAVSRASLHLRY